MDKIVDTLVAALSSGLSEMGKSALKDSYNALKNYLKKKLSKEEESDKLFKQLEANPRNEEYQQQVKNAITHTVNDTDDELKQLVTDLIKSINDNKIGNEASSTFNIKAEKIGAIAENIEKLDVKL
ncbi:hypothetical protein [Aliikangiella sp. IMCC44359]|uniref:hypothetical protein n=1 Tax=Aliikangiella sp. IMCC44359 TaxID=3459125 RepID=UPI00403B0533